jgi:hypothetical protein
MYQGGGVPKSTLLHRPRYDDVVHSTLLCLVGVESTIRIREVSPSVAQVEVGYPSICLRKRYTIISKKGGGDESKRTRPVLSVGTASLRTSRVTVSCAVLYRPLGAGPMGHLLGRGRRPLSATAKRVSM